MKPSAAAALRKIPRLDRDRILRKIASLEVEPRPPGVEKLGGSEAGFYRVRVGDYRIVYDIQDKVLLVLVVKVGNRKEVYRRR